MPLPLPRKVTELVGRRVYWQNGGEPVPATVVAARWSDTEVNGRAGVEFCLDTGDGPLVWSVPYPEPRDDEETE